MVRTLIIIFITLLCFSFWNLHALQNKKSEKKKKETQTKKLYDCKNYHQGKFTYTTSNGMKIRIHRESGFQFQYRQYPENYKKEEIVWLNDCKYRLKVIEIHDPILDNTMLGNENLVEISSKRDENSYEYSNWENGVIKTTGEMYIIRD